MSLNSFFASLLPKEEKFFPSIKLMSSRIVVAADLLAEFVSTNEYDKQMELYSQIKAIETECDEIMVGIYDDLDNSFVVPFDREDIHQLCNEIDDLMDYINDSAKRVLLYRPKNISNKVMHMAEIILESAKAVDISMGELKTMRKNPDVALEQCAKLHDLEHEGDDIYDNFVKDLFENEQDPKELIKMKDIMQSMETATDSANHIAKIIHIIIVKYA